MWRLLRSRGRHSTSVALPFAHVPGLNMLYILCLGPLLILLFLVGSTWKSPRYIFMVMPLYFLIGATWLVTAFGDPSDPLSENPIANEEDVGVWVFYDGGRDRGDRSAERNVASDIAVITGEVYDFTIEVDPETQSYIATVSDGTDSFTTGTLGWWTNCLEIGGLLVFDTRAGDVADDLTPEHRIFSLDDVVITQSPEEPIPGDANDDDYVNAADAAILADNWGAGTPQQPATWAQGNFDGDDVVGPKDAAILAANWGYAPGEGVHGVPEPGAVVLVAIGLAILAIRRWR